MTAPNTTNNVTVRKLVNVAEGIWNKSKDRFVDASGDTMTGRLTMEQPLSQLITGTGVVGSASGSTCYPSRWLFDLGIATPNAGDQMVIKIPCAGHGYGVWISTDNGTTYFPVARNTGTNSLTTHYAGGAYICVVFETYVSGNTYAGAVDGVYPVTGATASTNQRIGCWRVINDYDSGNNYDRLWGNESRFYAGATGCNPYSLVCLDSDGKFSMLVSSGSGTGTSKTINTGGKFKLNAVIFYYAYNSSASANGLVPNSSVYSAYPNADTRYSHNHTTEFTKHSPLYIECTIDDDGYWSPTTKCITQTLETGKYYIYLGQTYSTEYQLSLSTNHPLYYYDGTNLTERPNKVEASQNNGNIKINGTETNVYTHPDTSGNKHIPAGGSSGQFLGYDSDGTAKWVSNPNTDTKVKATAKTDNANYKILATASASPTTGAATEAVYDTDITLNPSTNTISANVSGTAASAGKLTTARTTYVTLGTASTSTTRDWSGTTTIPVSGTLGLGNGGTGATSAAGARTNLDVYSKSETESLLNGKVVVVTQLPATGESGVTYYVKDTSSSAVDKYDEYIWAKDAGASTESWIHVGEKSIDLSNYVNALSTSGSGPLVASLSKSGNTLTATMGTISIDDLSDWATDTDVTVSSVTYHTWWPVAPTSSNQVYGLSIYNGRLYRVYNNKGTYSVQNYDANTTYTNKSLGQGYGTCATEAETAAKIVTMSEYALTTGGIVTVKFTNALCTSATMNINGNGAKPIYIKGAAVTANNAATVSAGDTAYFMYDGTAYHLLGTDRAATNPIVNISRSGTTFTATRLDGSTFNFTQQDNNTTYTQAKLGQGYGTCTTAEATAAKSVTLTGYELEPNGVVAVKFTNGLCASATMSINGKTATPIYINGAAVTTTSCKEVLAGDLAFFIYDGSHYQFICTDRISKNGITGLSISGKTITYTRADGSTGTLTTQDTTYTFDGVYNSSSNKAATVSTVTNAVNALDVDDITGFGAGKTLATLTETDGKIAATFQNISITKSQVSDFSHAHGDISNAGCVQHSGDVAISADDKILIADKSASNKVQRSAITFDGSTTTTALTPKGTWESFAKAADITSAVEALDAEVTSSDGKNVNVKVTETNGKVTAVNVTTDTTANIANSVYYVVGALPFNTYSASATYTKYESGAYTTSNACIYNNYAYYCSTAITTAEAWNSSHWTRIATVVFTASLPEVTDMVAGLKIAFKFPCYGGSTSTQLAINTFAAKDLRRNTGNITTHVPPNAVAFFAYNGTYWSWADYYSDSWVTSMGAYCDTAAGTAAKTATSSNTVLTAGMAFLTRFTKTNTYAGKLTLNVNSQGAKDVYINGSISSSTNYTLPAGEHWCFYDGTNWNIWTDGTVQYKSLVVNGVHSDSYYASNLCKYFETNKYPTNVVIWTKCKWVSGSYMPVIRIYGNDYQRGGAWELKVAFYIYNDAFTNAGTTSIGSVAPSVYLWKYTDTADNKDYVAVGLTTDTAWANSQWYFRGFQVDVQLPASGNWSAINRTGWTTSSNGADTTQTIIPEVGTSKCVEAPYVSLHTTVSKASKLSTARELAVSLSNTSTTTTFDGSANVTNIKVSGTLGVGSGGTGKTSVTANSYLKGNGTGALVERTYAQVRTDLNVSDGANKVEASSTNGNIKIDGTETTVYTHPSQTAYTSKGSATKVPQITTDATGHVTGITEVAISGVTPASHSHGNIANGGTLTDTAAAAAGNDYVVIRDADNAKIQTSTIKGTDVADAVSKKHSHSTLTLSTTAQSYDGSHTLALPSTDPYTSARTPAPHSHGNITNDGSISSDGEVAISNNCSIVYADNTGKVKRSTVKFDGSTTTKALTQKGTFETFLQSHQDISGKEDKSNKVTAWQSTPDNTHYPSEKLVNDELENRVFIYRGLSEIDSSYTWQNTYPWQVYGAMKNNSIAYLTLQEGETTTADSRWGFSGVSITYDLIIIMRSNSAYRTVAFAYPNDGGDAFYMIVKRNATGTCTWRKLLHSGSVTSSYSSTGTDPVNGAAIAAALGTLDVSSVGGAGKYISAISETDGKISATATTMDTTPTASSTNAVTSGGVKTALDGKQNTLATQTAYTSKGTSTKVPQITTNTLGQVTGITEVEISGVSPAPHEHDKLSYTAWANASLPNKAESGVLRRFYCSLPNYNFCVKLFDVTQFYDGTIVDNGTENSSFVGDVSFHRIGGVTLVGKAKVVSGIAYNSTWVRLYGDNKFCHPIILKDSREIISTWISNSYIPIGDVGSTVSLTPTSNSNLAYCVIDCSTYSSMYINSYSVTGAPAWAFIDSTNKILTRSSGIAANSTVDVPQGAVKLICNVKNTTEIKTYCYVAIEAASPKYYLALHTEGVTMSCYMVCEGRFYTRMAATNTIAARPLLTSDYILANIGSSSPTIIPAGCSIQQNTIYNDVAGTLGTARELAVSLSNTSTTTTFNGSANVTNIKTTGTLGIANGGTGATTKKAAEFAINGGMSEATAAMQDNFQIVFSQVGSAQNATNGVFLYRQASTVWNYFKTKFSYMTQAEEDNLITELGDL